jgi:hypothetical protein
MKKIALVLLIIPFMAFHCYKNGTFDCVEGRIVRMSCASFIIQVLNNTEIGQDGWKDMMDNDHQYDNVINASNKCEISESFEKGNVIRFKISSQQMPNCAVCFLYDGPPNVAMEIKDVVLLSKY